MDAAPGKPLLIVGASARAAAQSALRRGRRPLAIDLFGDRDLIKAASVYRRIAPGDYPQAIPALAKELPRAPFIFTGGLENHPEVIAALEKDRPNEGSPAAALGPLRDPLQQARIYGAAGLLCPRIALEAPPASATSDVTWLLKPIHGAGGRGIAIYRNSGPVPGGHYLQERIEGAPAAAVYIGDGRGGAEFWGATLQLVGEERLGASPFAYCGSIGPLPLAEDQRGRFVRIGRALAASFPLRGFFGVDAILRDSAPYPVEVNPRFTASVEVLEKALGSGQVLGKAVLFARAAVLFPGELRWDMRRHPLADLPAAGTAIPRGRPILTVFAAAKDPSACKRSLLEAAEALYRELPEAAPEACSAFQFEGVEHD